MTNGKHIDIHKLGMDELAGVVNTYPWFGAARKELCARMASLAGNAWGESQYAEAALYVGSRSIIADIVRKSNVSNMEDKDVQSLLETILAPEVHEEEEHKPEVRVIGGDFFSQAQYDRVRKVEDSMFARFATKYTSEKEAPSKDTEDDFCTETLAEIYLEQGYWEQAARIYSKLSLRYPEKSAYFATLIEKLKNNNN